MKINGTYLTVREIYEAISNNDETLDGKKLSSMAGFVQIV